MMRNAGFGFREFAVVLLAATWTSGMGCDSSNAPSRGTATEAWGEFAEAVCSCNSESCVRSLLKNSPNKGRGEGHLPGGNQALSPDEQKLLSAAINDLVRCSSRYGIDFWEP